MRVPRGVASVSYHITRGTSVKRRKALPRTCTTGARASARDSGAASGVAAHCTSCTATSCTARGVQLRSTLMRRRCVPAASPPRRTRYSTGPSPRVRIRCWEYRPSTSTMSTAPGRNGEDQEQPPQRAETVAATSEGRATSNARSHRGAATSSATTAEIIAPSLQVLGGVGGGHQLGACVDALLHRLALQRVQLRLHAAVPQPTPA